MNLLYLTFGNNPSIHLQAAFSIYSFLTNPKFLHSINVITDDEGSYVHLGSSVNIIKVSSDELAEWKGEHDFFWRIKIKAIEKVAHLYPNEPLIYLDTDTFLLANLSEVEESLINGQALMHENEGALSRKKSKTEKRMWRQVVGKSFGNTTMQPTDCMWNAGVVGIPNSQNGKEVELALAICDDMCKQGVTKRLIEQYALSLALEKTYGLAEAKAQIAHYWSNKEIWNRQIGYFFIQAFLAQWSYEKIVSQMSMVNTAMVPIVRIKTTNERLKEIIDKAFPPKDAQFVYKK